MRILYGNLINIDEFLTKRHKSEKINVFWHFFIKNRNFLTVNDKTADKLMQLVDAIKGAPVLVIGDIMLDRFVYGHVDRISPESPVPVLSISREDKMLGGAGNALCSLMGLKTKSHIISVIGDDEEGKMSFGKHSFFN